MSQKEVAAVIDGDLLTLEMRRRGITQGQLAAKAGCSRNYVGLISRGYRPSIKMQRAIVKALGPGAEERVMRKL